MKIRHYQPWNSEELWYLENSVGKTKLETMAITLGRTEPAVRQMMYKMNLVSTENTTDIVLYHLSKMTGMDTSTLYWWVDNNDLPVKKKYLTNKKYVLVISEKEWWMWAKENKHLIDFNKYDFWTLGDIPEWVEHQKKIDKNNISKQNGNKKFWTKGDNRKLEYMCKQYKYTGYEIAKELGRTESSINMQIYRLGIKEWPLRAKPIPWTDKEKVRVRELCKQGYGSVVIAEKLGRTQQSVRREYLKAKNEISDIREVN